MATELATGTERKRCSGFRSGFRTALFFQLSLLVPAVLAAQTLEEPASEAEAAELRGVVMDAGTGKPLEVSVQLESEVSSGDVEQVTDGRGRFRFGGLAPGQYHVRIVRIGYRTIEHAVDLRARTEVTLEVELVPEAVTLDPVVVETSRESLLARRGFLERQEQGFGRFVTRQEIEERNPIRISDLLRTMSGIRVAGSPGSGSRGVVTMRGGCRAEIYVDGVRMIPPFGLDDSLIATDVEAIEVYRGNEAPPEYSGDTACGSVVVWTRRGANDGDRPITWLRLGVAIGLTAVGLLLAR